jgi:murein DD-endopeptidase MepM/ murein hydrolase activator NlpD
MDLGNTLNFIITRRHIMSTWLRPEGTITHDFTKHQTRTPASKNPGTDYAAPVGTPIKAIADGTITGTVTTFTGSGGRMIFQSFPSGHNADYLHLSRIDVQPGQQVKQGQVIGLMGGSGLGKENGYGSHLHLAFRVGGKPTMGAGNIDYEVFRVQQGGAPAAPTAAPAGGARPYPGRMLKQGEPANADVLYLQNKLGVNPTGPFGPKTHAAVVAFQKSKGLTADGIVGPLTWGKL